jgi:peptidoglycan/xylan/chitin deacetylase (PgdA/CDA1 family)
MTKRLLRSAKWRLNNAWNAKSFVSHLRAPVASFTFDDFPRSAWLSGGRILEDHGVRGTYFVSGSFDPARVSSADTMPGLEYFQVEDVRAAHANGHEIGCHTFDHVDVSTQSHDRLVDNIRRNAEYLAGILGHAGVTSFAYPRGETNIRKKYLLGRRFAVCRGCWPGVNKGVLDLSQLKCYGLDDYFDRFSLDEIIEEAKRSNGWIILNTHDVSESPSQFGYTPEKFRYVVRRILDAGIEVLPIKSALAKATFGS